MGGRRWGRWLFTAIACALLAAPAAAQNNAAFERGYREGIQRGADDARDGRRFEPQRDRVYRDGDRGYNSRYGSREWYRNEFRRGYSTGYRDGYYSVQGDGRYRRDRISRSDDRRIYRSDDGRISRSDDGRISRSDDGRISRSDDGRISQGRRDGIYGRGPGRTRGYQEPAFARGYSDGWEKGLDDGRDRDRYDPVRHGDYKDGDNGYDRSYGSKDAYRNNYRAGFRQGYEDGYRDGRGGYRR